MPHRWDKSLKLLSGYLVWTTTQTPPKPPPAGPNLPPFSRARSTPDALDLCISRGEIKTLLAYRAYRAKRLCPGGTAAHIRPSHREERCTVLAPALRAGHPLWPAGELLDDRCGIDAVACHEPRRHRCRLIGHRKSVRAKTTGTRAWCPGGPRMAETSGRAHNSPPTPPHGPGPDTARTLDDQRRTRQSAPKGAPSSLCNRREPSMSSGRLRRSCNSSSVSSRPCGEALSAPIKPKI